MALVLRINRPDLERVFKDERSVRVVEAALAAIENSENITLVQLRQDVDANTVTGATNTASILALQNDKADIVNPTFTNDITVNGDITVVGVVDGRDVSVDGAKLDTIESGATADQTPAEIKIAYESNADTNAFTDADESKLDGIESGAQVNTVDSVNGYTGVVVLAKSDVGLGSVDNTSDSDKPVSTAQQAALDLKQDILAEGSFVDGDKTKLDGITAGAEVNSVDSVNGYTGVVVLVKGDVGLGNVDNTSDADKPVSTAQQTALDGKKDDFTENTAFNKDFGTLTGEVCEGDDSRLLDSRTCNNTFDDAATARTNLDVYSQAEVDALAFTFTKNSQTPTTGFSITLTQDGTNQWLILDPSTSLSSGTITLIAPGSASDLQEVMISTTEQINSITIAGNGGSVFGAPSVLAAESTYRFKYDSNLTGWFALP